MESAGIYIHIPFCKFKCNYCDFYSITEREHQREHFTKMLCNEIEMYALNHKFNFKIDTIFIGGGTPSILTSSQLDSILNSLNKNYDLSNVTEITMEANPGEAPLDKLVDFRKIGINRLSMGFQSLQPELLKFLTRIHSREQALETFKNARDAGFENINVDLIFSIPNQSLKMLEEDLNTVVKLNPNHISAYSLTVESGTDLNKLVKHNKVVMPKDESDLEMLFFVREVLAKNGYNPYEISNFSLPNQECKHNLHYWNSDPYLAFGPSAHGYDFQKRWWNVRSLDEYLKRLDNKESPIVSNEINNTTLKFNELLLNGLRLTNGIPIKKLKEVNQNFQYDLNIGLQKWNNKLVLNKESLYLTEKGIPFLDSILPDIFIN
jgi:oxygen-independent coproporphyrinogen III oxidase